MEKNNNIIIIIFLITVLATFISNEILGDTFENFINNEVLYWVILALWLFSYSKFKLKTEKIFHFSFLLLLTAMIVGLFGIYNIAELFMRICLVGWFLGLGVVLVKKYRKV